MVSKYYDDIYKNCIRGLARGCGPNRLEIATGGQTKCTFAMRETISRPAACLSVTNGFYSSPGAALAARPGTEVQVMAF